MSTACRRSRLPEKLWTGAQDLVYALALDANGHLLIGSGNKGNLVPRGNTLALFDAGELSRGAGHRAAAGNDGTLYAATGNVGKVFRVGPGIEPEGTIESDVFDTGGFSTWGRLTAAGDLHGGTIALSARSGNLDRPQQNWSPWSTPLTGPEGGQITAPSARFVQWKATLNADGNSSPPRSTRWKPLTCGRTSRHPSIRLRSRRRITNSRIRWRRCTASSPQLSLFLRSAPRPLRRLNHRYRRARRPRRR